MSDKRMKVYSVECEECGEICVYSSEMMNDDPYQPMIICLKCFFNKDEYSQ